MQPFSKHFFSRWPSLRKLSLETTFFEAAFPEVTICEVPRVEAAFVEAAFFEAAALDGYFPVAALVEAVSIKAAVFETIDVRKHGQAIENHGGSESTGVSWVFNILAAHSRAT
jgi:hypothetical protein